MARLTVAQREEIVRRASTRLETQRSIALEFGITDVRVSQIAREAGIKIGRGGNCPDRRGDKNVRWKGGRNGRGVGYVCVYAPDHPKAVENSVYEHVIVAERALGKYLPPKAVVHHANRDRSDNRPENLVICQDHAYHMLIHQRMRAKEACGNPNWRKCKFCKRYDDPLNLYIPSSVGEAASHRSCATEYARRKRGR